MSGGAVWVGVIIFILINLFVAFLSRRQTATPDMAGYFLGNRKMNGFVSALSYGSTTYSAFMMVGLAGLTYAGGVGALGFELIYFMGVSLVALFGPRFWAVGKTFGYVTPSEMLGDRYNNKWVATVVSIASCIFLIPYSAVQLSGIGYLLDGMTGGAIPFTVGVVLATVLAIVFSLFAGIRSVMWTDALQALIMIVSSTIVVLLIVIELGGFGHFFQNLHQSHPQALVVPGTGYFNFLTFLGLTVPWFFFSLSNPQVSQRLYMPSSLKSMKGMLLGFLVFGFVYTLVSVLWGFSAVLNFPNLSTADLATPKLLSSRLVPPVLGIIVMIGIMAAAVSTIASILLTLSSLVARDVYGNISRKQSEALQLSVGKVVIPIISILAFLFSLLKVNLIGVLSVASSAGLIVAIPALIGAFFWKKGTAAGAITSVVVSGLMVILLELFKLKPLGLSSGIWGIVVSTILFVVISLFTTAPSEKANQFIDASRTALQGHK
jgi:solute:Na+ symporter, SSS family